MPNVLDPADDNPAPMTKTKFTDNDEKSALNLTHHVHVFLVFCLTSMLKSSIPVINCRIEKFHEIIPELFAHHDD